MSLRYSRFGGSPDIYCHGKVPLIYHFMHDRNTFWAHAGIIEVKIKWLASQTQYRHHHHYIIADFHDLRLNRMMVKPLLAGVKIAIPDSQKGCVTDCTFSSTLDAGALYYI